MEVLLGSPTPKPLKVYSEEEREDRILFPGRLYISCKFICFHPLSYPYSSKVGPCRCPIFEHTFGYKCDFGIVAGYTSTEEDRCHREEVLHELYSQCNPDDHNRTKTRTIHSYK